MNLKILPYRFFYQIDNQKAGALEHLLFINFDLGSDLDLFGCFRKLVTELAKAFLEICEGFSTEPFNG